MSYRFQFCYSRETELGQQEGTHYSTTRPFKIEWDGEDLFGRRCFPSPTSFSFLSDAVFFHLCILSLWSGSQKTQVAPAMLLSRLEVDAVSIQLFLPYASPFESLTSNNFSHFGTFIVACLELIKLQEAPTHAQNAFSR